ncbi:hypothetical protein SAMN05216229_12619 [Geopseudomonas sagittaria]|uniref:Uncharacterized protein n=1 Tax=Geopseudomonas sagittaria TaxID=1135990 RepID=A0A1I5Z127_9GAMM|nr:hypothetical protein [Pseudomonas sagittaria]SFQ50176.1 hypothetical protein SAMN05216229_12619 [Pseudomonas sagittaria]
MERNYRQQAWLDSAEALDFLHELTGLARSADELLKLCEAERCTAYIDCGFAVGPVPEDLLFVRKIRGAGHCELLEAGEVALSPSASRSEPLLRVSGHVLVRGMVWVWSDDKASASREEGIWRLDLSHLCRTLYFKPAEIEALAVRLQAGPLANREQRASA